MISLALNGRYLDLTADKYQESYTDDDNVNKSEAGTNLRAVTRTHIPTISVAYKCTEVDKAFLDECDKASSLTCSLWTEDDSGMEIEWDCWMSNYTPELISEDRYHRYYKVSFKLNDLEE